MLFPRGHWISAVLWMLSAVGYSAEPRVPQSVSTLLQDRDYAAAVKAIEAAGEAEDVDQDYLLYLKGRALHFQEKWDDAVATFATLHQRFPDSDWARRGRFAAGVSHARKGDYRQAELAYRAEAQFLLSADRKQEIADIYLEYADAFFRPAKEDQEPDYAKALDFFQRALKVGPKPENRPRIELLIGQCQQELKQWANAVGHYQAFIEKHAGHELEVEARFRLGQSHLGNKQPVEARRAWRDLLDLHGDAKSDRLPQAAFRLSETYNLPMPSSDEDLSLGVTALRRFLEKYPQHELAPQANLLIVNTLHNFGRYDEAATAAAAFITDERYAETEQIADARLLLGHAHRFQTRFDDAIATWREYLTKHPTHKGWTQAQLEIVNTEYAKALASYKKKEFVAARELFGEFLAKYPLDARGRRILYYLGQMLFAEEQWADAVAAWRRLVSKFPKSQEASQAQFMIAVTHEEKLGQLETALEEYRKLTWGDFEQQAKQRVARLTAKSLKIATQRVYRSDETPQIKLVTRNLEAVTVRIYTIDMETYFRKMHQARGIEALDIALIDPDHTFEFKIPDYKQYARHEVMVDVPRPAGDADDNDKDKNKDRSGVMAVTVSSKTLEATTLVLQSDLDIVVKSSRDEVLVFAENMRTGKPWPAARVLISDGQQVFAEGETADDGVFQQTFDELKTAADIRAFVISGNNTASNDLRLRGLNVAVGLSDKGYVYTDRPAYRPGQMVHLRGVIRRVAGDVYQVDEGQEFQVDVFDSRNRRVFDTKVQLNAFGAFHSHFLLTSAASAGSYRVVVRDNDKQSYQGNFTVHDYKLEPILLEVETQRRVVYRGEEIEGVIRAAYYYGAPLVGREIRYRLANDRFYSAKTDGAGEVHFKLPTREYRESQSLAIFAQLVERNLVAVKNVQLATRGYSLSANTSRDVYLAGESFELEIGATDPEGEPVEVPLDVRLYRETEIDDQYGEQLVEQREVETDASGAARVTLQIADGGNHFFRISGTDRFGNVIEVEHDLFVSDDEDATRLRILVERHTFKVGDVANLKVHWRDKPALALLTFQGAKILDYRLTTLNQGENELRLPMTAELAPNFDLAIAVMTDPRGDKSDAVRFHQASSPFHVERKLNVEAKIVLAGDSPPKRPLRPGDEVRIDVRTTDPQGKPVAAEVSLALVEQSLLRRFPPNAPPIDDYFRGEQRVSAVRTTSSAIFSYRPKTRPINARLLAESERREVAEAENHALRELAESVAAGNEALLGDGELLAEDSPQRPFVTSVIPVLDNDVDGADQMAAGDMAQFGGLGGAGFGGGAFFGGGGMFGGAGGNNGTVPTNDPFDGEQLPNQQALGAFNPAGGGMQSGATIANGLRVSRWGQFNDYGAGAYPGNLSLQIAQSQSLETMNSVAAALGAMYDFDGGDIQTIDNKGVWRNYRGEASENAAAIWKKFAEAGGTIFPNLPLHETAYWNPAVTTDEAGTATVTFVLPQRSTGWTLAAKAVTRDTLAGQTTHEFAVKKDLFGDLKIPAIVTDGDTVAAIASVHNEAVDNGTIAVSLKVTVGNKSTTVDKQLEVQRKGIHELSFQQELKLPENADHGGPYAEAVFELTVAAGENRDTLRRLIRIRPDGAPVFTIKGGTATGDATAFVSHPTGIKIERPRLQVVVGPSVEQSLLDAVLAPATWCQLETLGYATTSESAVADLMAGLALQALIGSTRDAGGPQVETLDARIRAAIGLLISSQSDTGGWSWAGTGGDDKFDTARAVWALSLAREAGYRVDDAAFNKAYGVVQSALANSAVTDYESKATLLHALRVAGHEDFPLANQLYRNRHAMSPAALAYLALAFAEMDRQATAEELLGLLGDRIDPKPSTDGGADPFSSAAVDTVSWLQSDVELRAIFALALQKAAPEDGSPRDGRLRTQIDWLMEHRTGHRWSPDKATGPAMLAVCRWFARSRFEGERYKLKVFVNDLLAEELDVDASSPTQTVEIDAKLLDAKQASQRVRFELVGRGRYTYQCVLGGFVASENLQDTTEQWKVARHFEPGALEIDGRTVPRGFDVLTGTFKTFRNQLTQLPVGRRSQVQLTVTRYNTASSTPSERLPYLVVTEPLPAGASVVENSLRGDFERFKLSPGLITFYLKRTFRLNPITYEIHGYVPGTFDVPPTIVRNAYRPDEMAVAEAKSLTVLPQGAASRDEYRLTPRELFEVGKIEFGKRDFAAAAEHLNTLVDDWTLQPNVYKETVHMLLDIHLEQGPAAKVVRYFEVIIEKFPDLEIPFAKLLQVGDAYHEIGEYERSYLVFRATVEASFLRESQLAGFLESQGEFQRSVDVMSRLLRQYPPEPYLATAEYALAQRVYAKAPLAADDEKLRQAKITRVDLIRDAWSRLDHFLTAYPHDPAADQASFSLANTLLELELYREAIDHCGRFAERYPSSDFLDSFWYIIGYCHYALGEADAATAMCEKVAEAKRKDDRTGRLVDSPNKWQAIYILGQIYHSLDQAAKAIEQYGRVKDRFVDARQAIEYFARKEIALPEVTTFRPGEAVEVELEFRNVARCDITVYRIDLLKFSLLRRDLSNITNINLAGIRPYHLATAELGDGKDYRDRVKQLALPLTDEGAYLVVCRGENLHTSGMVVITPLTVDIQETVDSGRVRATVRDVAQDRYVPDVHIKVIGTRNEEFVSGETDLRGIFVADDIRGRSMVIAQADANRYAFHRGQQELGPPPAPAKPNAPSEPQAAAPAQQPTGKGELLKGLIDANNDIQQQQQQQLEEVYDNTVDEGIGGGFGGGFF